MAVEMSINFPSRDMAALQRAMARNATEFGKSIPNQVKFAGGAIGRTLGTSTRVAPKYIALAKVNRTEARLLQIERRTGKQTYIGTRHYGGRPRQVTIWARGIAEARKNPRAQLGNRGLAKLSWRASVRGLPGGREVGIPKGGVTGKARDKAERYAATERRLKGDNPYVVVGSFLNYATAALEGGPQSVNTAIDRAARYMMHTMDGAAKKMLSQTARAK
jgi:hypothetical protein